MSEEGQDDLMTDVITDEEIGLASSKRRKSEFIRGPFSRDQFLLASRSGHGPLVIWQLAHHLTRLRKRSAVTLPNKLVEEAGVSRWGKYRAIAELERVGLISVDRSNGRSIRVSLVRLPKKQ